MRGTLVETQVSIQDFTIRGPILNFVGDMTRNKRFSGESGREPRRIFKNNGFTKHLRPYGTVSLEHVVKSGYCNALGSKFLQWQ